MTRAFFILPGLLGLLLPGAAHAWDHDGHQLINRIALQTLPADFPAFIRAEGSRERIIFLAAEPDRWRSSADYSFRHVNEPDHFFDLDYLDGFSMTPEMLPPFRYDFVAQVATAREKKPGVEPVSDPARDPAHYRAYIGFLPWAINEHYSKLRVSFSNLKAFELYGGTPDEIRNARENVIYLMGVTGHYVGDATQPLHTTKHYNGWTGSNPEGYATNRTFHAWIDGGYFARAGLDATALLKQAKQAAPIPKANTAGEGIFRQTVQFLEEQHRQVRPLYQNEKEGKLDAPEKINAEGRAFLEHQLLIGGEMLGNIWLTAWRTAPEDNFLKAQLAKRALSQGK